MVDAAAVGSEKLVVNSWLPMLKILPEKFIDHEFLFCR